MILQCASKVGPPHTSHDGDVGASCRAGDSRSGWVGAIPGAPKTTAPLTLPLRPGGVLGKGGPAGTYPARGTCEAFLLGTPDALTESVSRGESGRVEEDAAAGPLSIVQSDGGIEAALLIRRTGSVVAAWTRTSAPEEVLAVMSATMLASIGTIVESLGDSAPRTIAVTAGEHRIFAAQASSEQTLVLIAADGVKDTHLQELTRDILARLSARPRSDHPKGSTRVRQQA